MPEWQELSERTDETLRRVFAEARTRCPPRGAVALLAVGGYGRSELAPFSDLDLLLVHEKREIRDDFVEALWYPLWDSGRKIGHAVRTPDESIGMIKTDLETATALVSARVVAGDTEFGQKVIDRCLTRLRKQGRGWLGELHARVLERHQKFGEVAYLLEPDLKNGLGGLRDIHAMWWAQAVGLGVSDADLRHLDECNETLLQIRVALHRTTNRPGDVLHLQDQGPVAEAAGYTSDDDLMAAIATVARRVMWMSDEVWARLDPPKDRSRHHLLLAPGVSLKNGEVHLSQDADPSTDPTLLLRVATTAARVQRRISRDALDRLGMHCRPWPAPWPAGASNDLVALLLEGERAIPVWEALEQRNLVSRIIPEWGAVRCRPQRNAFHRYTVDRHLWQTAANAANFANEVARPDLLVLGALFHDLGKGYPGDHTQAGIALFSDLGPRMGLSHDDVETVSRLIEHHLLLPDIATRRDLSDDGTISYVAERVSDAEFLAMLHALTKADASATGPTAWGAWKEELVQTLVERTKQVLVGEPINSAAWRLFPDAETLEMMSRRRPEVRVSGDAIVVVCPDRSGLFASVAGALSVHGLDIQSAEAHSDEQGMAASRFHLYQPPRDGWPNIVRDVHAALNGQLNIEHLLSERVATYTRRKRESARGPLPPWVAFHNNASSNATVVEVHAPDRVGLLHAIATVFADAQLDIRHARIVTLGDNVVDTFYVREFDGSKIPVSRQSRLETSILKIIAA